MAWINIKTHATAVVRVAPRAIGLKETKTCHLLWVNGTSLRTLAKW